MKPLSKIAAARIALTGLCALAGLCALVGGAQAQRRTVSVEELCQVLELSAPDPEALRQGKLEGLSVPELGERDLAVGFAFWAKSAPDALARGFRDGVDLRNGPNVTAVRRITSFTAADFDSLRLSAGASVAEAGRYRKAHPGEELNLSTEELASLGRLGELAGPTKIASELGRLLAARVAAYRARGLAGIAPYERENGALRAPGEDLRALIARLAPQLGKLAPGVAEAILDYPRASRFPTDEAFFWIAYETEGRPVFTLRHRLSLRVGPGIVAVDRELYVSHGYDDMQAIALAFPDRGGTTICYRAHTFTERVAGIGSVAKHGLGRRRMASELEKMFERTRAGR